MADVTTARQTRRTTKKEQWRAPFLETLSATGNVSSAIVAADVSRTFVYEERHRDQDFAALWDAALDMAADALELEARRRAHDGWDEPVFGSMGQGQGSGQVGTVRKYSDTLLIFLLKGAKPEKYRERQQVEHTGKDGGPVEIADARNQLATILSRTVTGGNTDAAPAGDPNAAA